MDTTTIKKMIADAIEDEKQTGRLAGTLANLARTSGQRATNEQIQGGVSFIREYIEHVPYYITEGLKAAREAGLERDMRRILKAAESYWLEPFDFISDQLGLVGLVDDAYCSLCLIQTVSEFYRQQTGLSLLPHDLTPANTAIRAIIGEPTASQLDAYILNAIGVNQIQQLLGQLLSSPLPGPMVAGPDPYWGNASIDEIVNVQLGAMGIV